MDKRTTGPDRRIFTEKDVHDLLGLTMKPEEARAQLDKKERNVAIIAGVIIAAIWALLGFVFPPLGSWLIIWVISGILMLVLIPFLVTKYIEHRYTTPIKTDKIRVWRRDLVAMRAQSRSIGSVGDVYVLGFGRVDDDTSRAGYRYLYDTGDGFEIAEIPGKNTKVHLELGEDEAPFITCWQEKHYRESLLTYPPARLPYYEDGYEYADYMEEPYHYEIYLPKDSNVGILDMV